MRNIIISTLIASERSKRALGEIKEKVALRRFKLGAQGALIQREKETYQKRNGARVKWKRGIIDESTIMVADSLSV